MNTKIDNALREAAIAKSQKNWRGILQITDDVLADTCLENGLEEFFFLKAEAFTALHRPVDSDQALRDALDKFPDNFECHNRYMENAAKARNYPLLKERAQALQNKYPQEELPWLMEIRAEKQMNRFPDALVAISRALHQFEPSAALLYEKAEVLAMSGEHTKAVEYCLDIVPRFPKHAASYILGCKSLMELKRFDEISVLETNMMQEFPDNPNCNYQYLLNAVCIENWPEAMRRGKMAHAKFPKHRQILLTLSDALAQNGQLFESIAHYDKAMTTFKKESARINDTVARLLLQNNMYEEWKQRYDNRMPKEPDKKKKYIFEERGENSTTAFLSMLCEIKKYLSSKGADLYVYIYPLLGEITNKKDYEHAIFSEYGAQGRELVHTYPEFKEAHKNIPYADTEYLKLISRSPAVIKNTKGYYELADFCSKYVNIEHGSRVTLNYRPDYKNKFLICGSCVVFGFLSEDKHTIHNYLQDKFIRNNISFNAISYGIPGIPLESNYRKILDTEFNVGDKVVLIPPHMPFCFDILPTFCLRNKIHLKRLSEVFDRKRHLYGIVFGDKGSHLTFSGNQLVADELFDDIFTGHHLLDGKLEHALKFYANEFHEDIGKYESVHDKMKDEIETFYSSVPRYSGKNGAIVMNCNPMTNGHLHLIKLASKLVDHLYVFVVEENKSFFTFNHRFEIVKQECSKFDNVIVVPSGQFILSAVTFPEYFDKDADNEVVVDTSKDINIFCTHIAKIFNISTRFAGEEPFDKITAQYNNTMREILPKHNMTFIEIPRLKKSDTFISASYVRKLLKNNNFSLIYKIVPTSTYNLLCKEYDTRSILVRKLNMAIAKLRRTVGI